MLAAAICRALGMTIAATTLGVLLGSLGAVATWTPLQAEQASRVLDRSHAEGDAGLSHRVRQAGLAAALPMSSPGRSLVADAAFRAWRTGN